MFEYRKATTEDLERIWDKDIAENAGDAVIRNGKRNL